MTPSLSALAWSTLAVAGTSRRLRGVKIPKGVNMTIIASPKGSYRTEHIFQFLDTWLDPWTEERAKRQDWRMLFLDVAKSHLVSSRSLNKVPQKF